MKDHVMLGVAILLSLGGPCLARPESAADVLERTRRALGYERIAELNTGIECKGTVKIAGLECSYSLLFGGDRACLQRIDGPLSLTAAIDGETVWITDIGGETRAVVNADRENWETGLLILNHGWLGPGSRLEFEDEARVSDAGEVLLNFRLCGGRLKGTVTVDQTTWLPKAWAYSAQGGEVVVTLGDYGEFAGVKLPKSVSTLGSSSMEVRIESMGPGPVFIRSPFEMIGGAFGDTTFDPGVSPELEVVKAPSGHLLVHPLVNGKDVGWFIFDTGAGSMVLSTPVAEELGVTQFGEVPAHGIGGKSTGAFCRPESVTLGQATMTKPLMVTLDLSFLEQHMGRRIAGLVGYNLLARVTARIDMEAPSVSVYDPGAFNDQGLAWQELVVDQRIPMVRARFEGHEGLFRLDTGAAQMAVSMHAPAVREFKLLEGREVTDAKAGGVGGTASVKRGTLAWFELAGNRTENVKADFAVSDVGIFGDPYTAGNIGGVLLRPFVIVTDYGRGRIAFVRR